MTCSVYLLENTQRYHTCCINYLSQLGIVNHETKLQRFEGNREFFIRRVVSGVAA